MVTQIIRGQAVSTAIAGASPVATVSGQGAASPTAVGQTQPGTPRAQGQGQVKLTLAQLGQLIQVSEESLLHKAFGRLGVRTGESVWICENPKGNVYICCLVLEF